jgi:PKD repeat protein
MNSNIIRTVVFSLAIQLFAIQSFSQKLTPDQLPYVEGELIVQIKPNQNISKVLERYASTYNFQYKELSSIMRAWLVSFDPLQINHFEAKMLLEGDKSFSVVQNNHKVNLRSIIPNDPQFDQQWHHRNIGQNSGTVDADIDTDEAWEITTGGTTALNHDIVVCIIEGVNMTHPDLIANRWINTGEIAGNGIDDDGNGYIDDVFGWNVAGNNGNVGTGDHGTSVVGMIGAKGDNAVGVVGANWDVKIMVVSGHNANNEANIIAAYNYPLTLRKRFNETNGAQGALVVATNASWGIDNGNPASVPLWCAFYDTLGVYGILNCGATTNSNLNVDVAGDIPTACPSPYMIGVGRTDRNDNFAGGYGLNTIDIAAPGINVRTTNSNGYTTTTGTSFASPLTAGVIALMYSIPCVNFASLILANPQMGADLVRQALLEGVDPKPQLANFFITGGRLNAKNSIDLLMNMSCDGICLPPSIITTNNIGENSAIATWNAPNDVFAYKFYYRQLGNPSWVVETINDTFFVFSGLEACSQYEYYIESDCDSSLSSPTSVFTFNTLGCGNCVDLNYCSSSASGSSQIALTVVTPTNISNNYAFVAPTAWGANLQNTYCAGQMALVNDGTANATLGCNTLTNASEINGKIAVAYRGDCEFGIKALNAQNAGAIGIIIINNVAGAAIDMAPGGSGAQITIPVVMVTNTVGATIANAISSGNSVNAILGTKSQWIESISVATFNNTSGNNGGYGDYLTQSTIEIEQNNSYSFNINPGYGNQPYGLMHKAWIDYNQDGVFSNNELIYESTGLEIGNINSNFNVPQNSVLGSTRMRILTAYIGPGQTSVPESCGEYIFGETEDYCVNISSGCNFTATLSKTDVSCFELNDGTATVTVSNATTPVSYLWSHDANNNSPFASNLSAQSYNVKITDGEGCEEVKNFVINQPAPAVVAYTSNIEFLTVSFTNMSSAGNYLWTFGDGNSSIETNPTHSYSNEGNYTVCLQLSDNCGIFESCQEIDVKKESNSSINENLTNNGIKIYPNPSEGVINFEINSEQIKYIEIYFINGKLIKKIQVNNIGVLPLDFSNLSDGVYFYKAIDLQGIILKTERILINK